MKRLRYAVTTFAVGLFTPWSSSFILDPQPSNNLLRRFPHRHRLSSKRVGASIDSGLEARTRALLRRNKVGNWPPHRFQNAKETLESWTKRQSRRSSIMAERIVRRVVEEHIAGNPNSQGLDMAAMYKALLQSWAYSGEKGAAQRAEEILDNMQSAFEDGDESLKPDIGAVNTVLMAYVLSGQPDAPQQTLRVIQKLQDWNSIGKTDVVPNKESYAAILRAYAKVGGEDSPALVYKLLTHMEKLASEGFPSVKPDYLCHNVYLGALLDGITRGNLPGHEGAQRAHGYLDQMMSSDDEDARPDTWSFNIVISAWSKSGVWYMTERTEALVTQLETYHELSGKKEKTRPNTNTYNCLIASYSRSSLRDKAERANAVLDTMKHYAESGLNPGVRPDVVTYNSVMNAYAKSKENNSPLIVEDLLREMQDKYEQTGDRFIKPNSRSFNTCVDAWAKSNHTKASDRIMDWIEKMQANVENGSSSIRPNKWTYNAYLQALSKSGRPTMGDEAEQLLEEMEKIYQRGRSQVKPDVLTFTNVIHCIALSGADNSLDRALAILSRMEDLHAAGHSDVRPNTYTYNCVINAAAKSKRPNKVKTALQILRRMQSVALRPLTVTYNNVLNACAFSEPSACNGKDILHIALEILQEAQGSCGANYITYGTSLRVVCAFEEDKTEKWRLTRDIFRQCCDDGQLTKLVMHQVKYAVSPAQYALLKSEAKDERTGRLREDCTKNARRDKFSPATKKVIA